MTCCLNLTKLDLCQFGILLLEFWGFTQVATLVSSLVHSMSGKLAKFELTVFLCVNFFFCLSKFLFQNHIEWLNCDPKRHANRYLNS